jgi:hypothetical protein
MTTITTEHVFLEQLASDFADGVRRADARLPVATSHRSGKSYQSGIGPHSETQTVALVLKELREMGGHRYAKVETDVPYPRLARQRCDLVFHLEEVSWHVEVKMMRMLGDNGKTNDNILAHILSPYPQHRSALTDCAKLVQSGFSGRYAILVYGFDYDGWPLDPVMNAFETLAQRSVRLCSRSIAAFDGLIHPVHRRGRVFAWEVASVQNGPEQVR